MASGSTVGTAIIKLSFDGKDVKAELNNMGSEMEKTGKNTGSIFGNAWSVAAGSLISKGVSKIASTISSNLGRAISRVDTINNFPKVMTALGYSSEEASSSVNAISEALDGLPTALDQTVSDVQKLAATMGNLNTGMVNATSLGISLNNMFLAGGKGTEAASNAMEQYNQMLAAGKADMQSWRSILDAAPGQLNQLAKTLLGATADQNDLREAINDGTVSFEQMNQAIVELNQNGGDGFASFEEQARSATGGIGTAIDNVKNRIGKAIAKIIDHIGSERIAEAIDNISKGFSGVADVIIGIIDFLSENQWIVEFIGTFAAVLGVLSAAIWVVNAAMMASPITWIILGVAAIIAGIILLITHIQEVGQWFNDTFGWIGAIVGGVANFIGEVFSNVFSVIGGIISGIGDLVGNVFGFIGSFIGNTIGGIIGFFEVMGNVVGTVFNAIKSVAETVFNVITGIIKAPINGIISAINGVLSFINSITVPDWVPIIGGAHTDFGMIPLLARGGIVDNSTLAVVGEAGKEAVIPLENNTDNWAGMLADILVDKMDEDETTGTSGRPIEVNMVNQINNEMDAQDIGRVMMQSIRRAA